ncbi:MAG TPA: WD40 repeat domain-containing protein [Gemmataceae bacterium]|nr:WD40 repeat domain-containing protein [Gemmataceae bacterium]
MRYLVPAAAAWLFLSAAAPAADEPARKCQPATTPAASGEEIDRLILQLGDDDMTKRKSAMARLEAIGEPVVARLKRAAESADDPEVRKAAKLLLEKFDAKARGLLYVFGGSIPRADALAISADGKRAVSAAADGALRYYDLDEHALIRQIVAHQGQATCVALSPDGRRVLSGGNDRMMKLWDLESGAEIRSFAGHGNVVLELAFSADGKTAVSACSDGNGRHWDLASGKLLQLAETGADRIALTVALTPDGKKVVTGGQPWSHMWLWDLSTGKQGRHFEGHDQGVRRVAISPDGERLLSAGFDGMVRLWDLGAGKEIKTFEGHNSLTSVSFTPDGKRAVCSYSPGPAGAADGQEGPSSLKLWDLASGKEIKQFSGLRYPVQCFAISGDGRRLISGCTDGTIQVWEMPK